MKYRTWALIVLIGAVALPSTLFAQGYGEGLGIGGVLLPDRTPTVLVTSRLGESLALELGVALNVVDTDRRDETTFGIGFGLRRHWNVDQKLQPYIGGRATLSHQSIKFGDTDTSEARFGLIGVLGGEYFVMRNLSITGEIGFGMYFGSFEISTGTRLAAFLYL